MIPEYQQKERINLWEKMGNSSSSHQPLERGFTRGTFGDIKNVVGIKFHNSNENIESVACGFPGNLFVFVFIHSFEIRLTFHFRFHRRQLRFAVAKDPQKKWIDFANHSVTHFEGAKIVYRKLQSHINGNPMRTLCGRQRVSLRSNTLDALRFLSRVECKCARRRLKFLEWVFIQNELKIYQISHLITSNFFSNLHQN